MAVRPVWVSNQVISREGGAYVITFENQSRQTSVRLSLRLAVQLVENLQAAIALDMTEERKPRRI